MVSTQPGAGLVLTPRQLPDHVRFFPFLSPVAMEISTFDVRAAPAVPLSAPRQAEKGWAWRCDTHVLLLLAVHTEIATLNTDHHVDC